MDELPTLIAKRTSSKHSELDFIIPPEHVCFEGHFPGHPILPGVVQVGWAVIYSEELYGYASGLDRLERVKFMHPILPGMRLTLHLKVDNERRKIQYEYRDSTNSYASGTLYFRMTQ